MFAKYGMELGVGCGSSFSKTGEREPAGGTGQHLRWSLLYRDAGVVKFVCFASALFLTWAPAACQPIPYERLRQPPIQDRLESIPDKHRDRYVAIEGMLRSAGCDGASLVTQKVGGAREPNVICTLPGESDSPILVGAHFDASPKGDGVVDNWTGAILLASLYESLKKTPRQHTIIFADFSGEEKGLLGSRQYLGNLSKEERQRLRAMVNMDSLGMGPPKVWLSHSDQASANHLAAVAASLDVSIAAVDVDRVGTGDHEPFWRAGIPCLVIHSVTQDNYGVPHSRDDNIEAVRMDDYYDTYVLLAAYLAYIDAKFD